MKVYYIRRVTFLFHTLTHTVALRKILRGLIGIYFEEEAQGYDEFTQAADKRKKFVSTVNRLVSDELKTCNKISSSLSVACGTGSREKAIFEAVGISPKIIGVDVSSQMCALAEKNGLKATAARWLDANLDAQIFDSALYLHSFGLAPSSDDRALELRKIARHLKPSAPLFIDVINLDDQYEWGPKILKLWEENELSERGFERGDLFYRRKGKPNVSFYHYFTKTEMQDLLESAGLSIKHVFYIGYGAQYGELVGPTEGAMLFVATRK